MAYSRGLVSDYKQLNTIPAIVGIVFAIAAGVQFLQLHITLGLWGYTFPTDQAMLVSLGSLVVAFASSETKDWHHYESYEQAIVGGAVVVTVGAQYISEIGNVLTNNQPVAGVVAFAISMAAWGVLSR